MLACPLSDRTGATVRPPNRRFGDECNDLGLQSGVVCNHSGGESGGQPMTASPGTQPRVGLVLGAGGILGGAWLTGGLYALADEFGWDPGSASQIVGTS